MGISFTIPLVMMVRNACMQADGQGSTRLHWCIYTIQKTVLFGDIGNWEECHAPQLQWVCYARRDRVLLSGEAENWTKVQEAAYLKVAAKLVSSPSWDRLFLEHSILFWGAASIWRQNLRILMTSLRLQNFAKKCAASVRIIFCGY